jgi:serine/threonine-protein kinase RsbW
MEPGTNGNNRAVSPLPASRPPEHAAELHCWTLGTAAELSGLRAKLHQALTGTDLVEPGSLDEVPEQMVLVASELATNAIRHGAPPTEVRLLDHGDQLVLDVADRSPGSAPELVSPEEDAIGGRGLQIAQMLSIDVGWYRTHDAKHIWATFPRHDVKAGRD